MSIAPEAAPGGQREHIRSIPGRLALNSSINEADVGNSGETRAEPASLSAEVRHA